MLTLWASTQLKVFHVASFFFLFFFPLQILSTFFFSLLFSIFMQVNRCHLSSGAGKINRRSLRLSFEEGNQREALLQLFCFSWPAASRASTVLLGADWWSDRRYPVGTKLPPLSHRDGRQVIVLGTQMSLLATKWLPAISHKNEQTPLCLLRQLALPSPGSVSP